MAHAIIAFITALVANLGPQTPCAPIPVVAIVQCKDATDHNKLKDHCPQRSWSGRTTYDVYTVSSTLGWDRDIYQVWLVSTSSQRIITKNGARIVQVPNLDVFIANEQNGTLWPRQRPASCDMPVTEGFDP